MGDSTKAALAASVAAGYLLGRGRRMKLALAIGAYLASGRMRAKPQELIASGTEKLGDSPQLSRLAEQMRTDLLDVGRQTVQLAVDRRLGAFAEALAERTDALNGTKGDGDEAEGEETAGPPDEEPKEEQDTEEQDTEKQDRKGSGGTRPARPARPARPQHRRSAPAAAAGEPERKGSTAPPRRTAQRSRSQQTSAEPPRRRR